MTLFPGNSASDALVLPDSLISMSWLILGQDQSQDGRGPRKSSPGDPYKGGKTCSQGSKGCKWPSNRHSPSPSSSRPSPSETPTQTSSLHPSPTSTQAGASHSGSESSSPSTNPSSSTGGRPPQLSLSSDPESDTRSQTISATTPLSSSSPFLSTTLLTSSQSGVSVRTSSISPVSTPIHQQSPSPGLSARAAVGLALGVFSALFMLVAAALFFFLRRCRLRRSKRDSAGSDSSRRQLTAGGTHPASCPSHRLTVLTRSCFPLPLSLQR